MQISALRSSALRTARTVGAGLALFAAVAVPATPASAAPKPGPDLAVRTMMPETVNPAIGEDFSTTIDVRNYGAGVSDTVTVTVTVSPQLRPEAPTGLTGWACSTGPTSWTCTTPGLAAGTSAPMLRLSSLVVGGAPGDHPTVTATITPQRRETYPDNNSSSINVVIAGLCTVRGTIWQDLNGDGQRQPEEPTVAAGPGGVVGVSLWAREGQARTGNTEATVNPDGTWSIEARTGTLYEVRVEAANTYDFTSANVGDDGTDSDITHGYQWDPTLLGASDEFLAEPDATYVVDAGLVARS
ncbi:SdrD B-like domain-containing protein [Plantactinospora siamensis]|uniref:SdrD B-like domain-containing protein n=1 Tax=Plantactinospora siamensis TaxID=555372 RepID=A0ABV6NR23_9ACTN